MTNFDPRTVHHMPAQQFGTPRNDVPQFGSGPFRAPQVGAQQFGTQGFPGQHYPGPVPPPPSQPTRKPRPMAAKIVAGMVAAGLVLGGAGTWLTLSGSSAEAAVQTTSFAGAHPTTNPFGTDAPQVAAVAATGPQTGDTTGLYAATTPPSCDNASYLTQLQADPAKLAAFGGVYGISTAEVPAFITSLSPVVLRAATSVTDHPYTDGAFTEQPAILASGTAVLVNSYGEPTVKCFNGNPLTAGAQAPDAVTITPTTEVITQFSFTTIDNSRVVVEPGKPDPKTTPGPNPTTTPQPDPALVKKAQETKALAEQARTEATAARQRADEFKTAATIAATNLKTAQDDLDRAKKDGANDTVLATLQQVLTDAKTDAETKANQAKFADAAARSAEGTATQAEKNAQDAQKAADDSAKTPDTKDPKDPKPATDPAKPATDPAKPATDPATVAGQQGQTPVEGQTGTQACTKVVNDAATPICPVTGTADTATGTTPAKDTTTGTQTGTESKGTSTGSSSQGSSSTSSSSTSSSSSQSSEKGGSDQ